MKHMQKTKTVQTEAEHGILSRFTGIFKKKTKEKIKKITKIAKNDKERKHYSHVTEIQVRKIFRLKKDNPKLSNIDIGKAIGIGEVLVRYYLEKGKTKSLKTFKDKQKRTEKIKIKRTPKIKPIKTTIKLREQKIQQEMMNTDIDLLGEATKKGISVLKNSLQNEITEKTKKFTTSLTELYSKEKYPVEHQSDPKYFKGSNPPESVATEEDFIEQKRKNNINRAVVAKKLHEEQEIEATKTRLRRKHQAKTPKIHDNDCPSCNPDSPMSLEAYQHKVRKESWRRKTYAEDQIKLLEKEKELDKVKKDLDLTVAERTQQGTKLCITCDIRLSYGQATRSQSMYGANYCADHEP